LDDQVEPPILSETVVEYNIGEIKV